MTITARSYCSGYEGLTHAARQAFGDFDVLSHSDIKPAANALLAHHYPHVPNLGDMRAIDYTALERADLMIGSWPCQPHSSAGKRLGEADPRDLWPEYLRAIRETRPAIFFGENVARIASNGELRRAVHSLAELGYVGAWRVLSAADVGACHLRKRCFLVAIDGAATDTFGFELRNEPGWSGGSRREGSGVAGHDGAQGSLPLLKTPTAQLAVNGGSQHPDKRKAGGHGPTLADEVEWLLPTPAVADSRNTRNATAGRSEGQGHHHSGWTLCDVAHADRWGRYASAIARHERAFRTSAPSATMPSPKLDGRPILNPRFVEWMMGVPTGWVTNVPTLTAKPTGLRNAQLSLLGDGVVPAQGAAAFGFLLDHLARRFAAEVAA